MPEASVLLADQPLAFPAGCDVVVPLFQLQWSTRAVLEGVVRRYGPRNLYVITPETNAGVLNSTAEREGWDVSSLVVVDEESFFVRRHGRTKQDLADALDLGESLYQPGWFYQQLLKLGADEGIPGLSDAYLVWDADLLVVDGWPAVNESGRLAYALLQDRSRGNEKIIACWARWIDTVLGVEPITDERATFVPHHMWFVRQQLETLRARVAEYYADRTEPWPELMMRSAGEFGTFSEFWLYASWVQARHADEAPRPLPYEQYGATTERFFEDGSAPFATAARHYLGVGPTDLFRPAYADLICFVEDDYSRSERTLPSSLSFEASVRHRRKGRENMHVEELRSPWHSVEDGAV